MDFGQAKIASEHDIDPDVFLCLKTLYSVAEGTQPLDREFGMDTTIVGFPPEIMKNKYALDVITKTEKYEPRVKVKEVTFEVDEENGLVIPTIHLEVI